MAVSDLTQADVQQPRPKPGALAIGALR